MRIVSMMVTLVVYLGLVSLQPAVAASDPARVDIAQGKGPMGILVVVAKEKGFFARHGVEVILHTYNRGILSIRQGMIRDNLPGAIAGATVATLEAFSHPHAFTIVTELAFTDNLDTIIARPDRGITSPGDLAGKRIAVPKGGTAHFFLMSFLEKWNIPANRVEIVFLSKKEMVKAIATGSVDAICQHDPVTVKVREALHHQTVEFREEALARKITVLLFKTSYIKAHPQRVQAVLQGIADAGEYMQEHFDECVTILAREKNIPVENARDFLENTFNFRGLALSQSLVLKMEYATLWAIGAGLGEREKAPQALDLIDYSLLEHINPGSVTIIRRQ